ncbi:hypothetical protein DY000_02035205 [Brassica cretica]|uniref:ATP synthase mitochondrial F1 complex assembly factor 1 n=1 Tax=Brassica cretica TaxID=69181 RepID=A0ABQ7DT17_BRACR|nr:hypothetical protein DY000_02035205 [Brassica cretica]
MRLRRILSSISNLATEKLSFSSYPSRQIFTARSSSSQRNAGSNLSEALPGNHIKWASLGSVRNSRFASGFTPLQPKPLDSIMDLERAKTKSPEELTSIWDDVILTLSLPPKFIQDIEVGFWDLTSRYQDEDLEGIKGVPDIGDGFRARIAGPNLVVVLVVVCRSLLPQMPPASPIEYRGTAIPIEDRDRACVVRYFVIPLWRGSGYITMFAQVEAPHMIFTGLEDYKARGTQAAPYLTSTFYTELSETKDLVLIRGDVVFTSKLTDEEAKWIMETAQSFYLNDTRYKLLERFNKHTHDFEFKDVLQALDMPIL